MQVPVESINVIHRDYQEDDPTLEYPYRKNTVPSSALYILVFAFSGTVYVLGAIFQRSFADGCVHGARPFAFHDARVRPRWAVHVATTRMQWAITG